MSGIFGIVVNKSADTRIPDPEAWPESVDQILLGERLLQPLCLGFDDSRPGDAHDLGLAEVLQ